MVSISCFFAPSEDAQMSIIGIEAEADDHYREFEHLHSKERRENGVPQFVRMVQMRAREASD